MMINDAEKAKSDFSDTAISPHESATTAPKKEGIAYFRDLVSEMGAEVYDTTLLKEYSQQTPVASKPSTARTQRQRPASGSRTK